MLAPKTKYVCLQPISSPPPVNELLQEHFVASFASAVPKDKQPVSAMLKRSRERGLEVV